MDKEIITIGLVHKYEVTDIKEGGMGRVLLLNRITEGDCFMDAIMRRDMLADSYSLIHRSKLAAKTFKDTGFVKENVDMFERELNIWINIDGPNIAKLLKIDLIDGKLYALMPLYKSNLRDELRNLGRLELSFSKSIILHIIHGLYETHKKYGIVHLDLKPENILVDVKNDQHVFHICDWGIAKIQRKYFQKHSARTVNSLALAETMKGMGTLPYMSPERFFQHQTDVTADIYSVGMIFYELLIGELPFTQDATTAVVDQIINHDYYHRAQDILKKTRNDKISKVILKCIHPNKLKRYQNYGRLPFDVYNIDKKKRWFFF